MNDRELIEVLRKWFEAWARDTFYSGLACPSETWSESRAMYNDHAHHMAFKAWQAALDSVVVELPVKISSCNVSANGFVNPNAEHYDEAIDDCAEAIHAAGVKAKVKA